MFILLPSTSNVTVLIGKISLGQVYQLSKVILCLIKLRSFFSKFTPDFLFLGFHEASYNLYFVVTASREEQNRETANYHGTLGEICLDAPNNMDHQQNAYSRYVNAYNPGANDQINFDIRNIARKLRTFRLSLCCLSRASLWRSKSIMH